MSSYVPSDEYVHNLHFLPVNIVVPSIDYRFIKSKLFSNPITEIIYNSWKRVDKVLKEETERITKEEEKVRLEETIINERNLFLLKNKEDFEAKYGREIANKVAKTLHSSKIEFTEKGAQELARSYEVDSNRNEHNSEEIYLSHLCIDLGICEL